MREIISEDDELVQTTQNTDDMWRVTVKREETEGWRERIFEDDDSK